MNLIQQALRAILSPAGKPARRAARRPARVYIDAAHFDPRAARHPGPARILTACNEAGAIAARVRTALRDASGVVVIDQGSVDGTAYRAAQAGALVVLQEPGVSPDQAVQKAIQAAKQFSNTIQLEKLPDS